MYRDTQEIDRHLVNVKSVQNVVSIEVCTQLCLDDQHVNAWTYSQQSKTCQCSRMTLLCKNENPLRWQDIDTVFELTLVKTIDIRIQQKCSCK